MLWIIGYPRSWYYRDDRCRIRRSSSGWWSVYIKELQSWSYHSCCLRTSFCILCRFPSRHWFSMNWSWWRWKLLHGMSASSEILNGLIWLWMRQASLHGYFRGDDTPGVCCQHSLPSRILWSVLILNEFPFPTLIMHVLDLSFVVTIPFAWKVAVIVAISALPLWIFKLIRNKVKPSASSKLL